MEMVDRDAAAETDDSFPPTSEEGHDDQVMLGDYDGNDDAEAATSLLGGGKSRYYHQAAAGERNEKDEKDNGAAAEVQDHRHSPCLSLLAASLCPCYLLTRGTTLLTEEEVKEGDEDGDKNAARHLNREGWWTCLSSCLLASMCPLLCLWPTLACTHRIRQREEIKRRYPHFPSLTPSSTSSFPSSLERSSSSAAWSFPCLSFWPCSLVEEVSFLEEMKKKRRRRRRIEKDKIEVTAPLPLAVTVAAGKADGKGKGGAVASTDTKWEPFDGWDMRPIAAAAAPAVTFAASNAVSNGSGGGAVGDAEKEGKEGEGDKEDEKSTKDVIIIDL